MSAPGHKWILAYKVNKYYVDRSQSAIDKGQIGQYGCPEAVPFRKNKLDILFLRFLFTEIPKALSSAGSDNL